MRQTEARTKKAKKLLRNKCKKSNNKETEKENIRRKHN